MPRSAAYPFAADPSQQLARMDGEEIRELVDGAAYLFTNDYEKALIEQKTGWSRRRDPRPGRRPRDHAGRQGRPDRPARASRADARRRRRRRSAKVDPTGVGRRASAPGFLAASGLGPVAGAGRAARLPPRHATSLETVGTQEYELGRSVFVERFADAYGDEAAAEVARS